MPTANYKIADRFNLQFVWQIPSEGFVRAIFEAEVEAFDTFQERYIVRLNRLVAKKEESPTGTPLPLSEWSAEHWTMIEALQGKRAAIGYEAQDGRPLRLQLKTLTLEHSYFTKH